ncbi:MAG TPA: C25 family cysteine peptidase [Pyrinomonadaceae bacterium]|jgi:hypothetical protein
MKKIVSLSIIVVLYLTTVLPVFSQKIKIAGGKPITGIRQNPIIKNETPTGVKLASASGFSDGNGVYLQWQAEYENRNAGFFVYRGGAKGLEPVSEAIVGGAALTSSEPVVYGGKYTFFDPNGNFSTVYYIETLNTNGERQIAAKIVPQFLRDLKPVAGLSSRELAQRQAETKPSQLGNELNLPKEMKAEIEANTLAPNPGTQRWVAAQPGVKISVKKEGFYRVSRAALQSAGFDVNAAGNLWQLYADGNEQAIIVGANDSYIEFYGKGIDTPESDIKVYYLVVGTESGKRIQPAAVRPLLGNVAGNSYFQSFLRKDRAIYISSEILNGDDENYFGNVAIQGNSTPTPPIKIFTFNLTGVDFNAAGAQLDLGIQGIFAAPHEVKVTLNGVELGTITGSGKVLMNGSYPIPTSVLHEGQNTLELQAFGGLTDASVIESIKASYNRKYEAMQNQLSFYTSNYRTTVVSGFASQNVRAFDLSYPDTPTLISNLTINNNNGNYNFTIPSNRGRAVYAVEDSAILAPASITANTPSTLSTTAHNGELIIVSYKDWMTQSNDWANYRRSQGLSVEVVNVEDIYDEFSYGTPFSSAMTQFFEYAKNNWQTAPNYVLLMGDMSYDFRQYENFPFQNYILTKRVDTLYEETASDEALCDFNNDGLAEIAVGRIPARNPQMMTQIFNKVAAFEAGMATAFNRGALFAYDLPEGYDFEDLSHRAGNQLPANVPKSYIFRGDPDSHNLLIADMNMGRWLINYSGHGSAGNWASNWLTNPDALGLTNAPNYSVFVMLTCLNGYFIRTDFDCLGEALLKAQNGGAPAVWASSGKTTPDIQDAMAMRFYAQITAGNMTRFGDLIKDAKQTVVGGRDVRLSWVLLGDPTMKIRP